MKHNDLILLQEHWLPAFDKQDLQDLLPGWKAHSACDEEGTEEINLSRRPVTYGGVATLWNQRLAQYVDEPTMEGNERILVTCLSIPNNPLCIINCYLPSGNSRVAMSKFVEDIDLLHTIIERYATTHEILLMGDLNEDHYNRSSKKEKMIRDMIKELQLKDLGVDIAGKNTYENPHLQHSSHIDHAMIKKKFARFQWQPASLPHLNTPHGDYNNTSYHHPVQTVAWFPIVSKKAIRKKERQLSKKLIFKRKETNPQIFQETLNQELQKLDPNLVSTDSAITILQSMIDTAMISSTPYIRPNNNLQKKKKSVQWTVELKLAISKSKEANYLWNKEGRPGKDHRLWQERKTSKRRVRAIQRRQGAEERRAIFQEITEASENDSRLLHKLIRRRRSQVKDTPGILADDNLITDEEEIRQSWATYFEGLSTPTNHNINTTHVTSAIEKLCHQDTRHKYHISLPLLEDVINNLSRGKAADINGYYAEQLQLFPKEAKLKLLDIINKIFDERMVPNALKYAYKLPIPKKGKDARIKDNYRGITVSSIILKTVELICLRLEMEHLIDKNTNDLQFGFTKCRSPSMASLLITESIAEAMQEKQGLYIASLDARKAFDVVSQNILLNKLHELGTSSTIWEIINSIYTDSKEVVRWKGLDSRPYCVLQGVKQGSILSPSLYKTYINNLLDTLQKSDLGAGIGTTFIGSPACADDVLLISHSPHQLQAMLNTANEYSVHHAYEIHPQKSVITTIVKNKKNTMAMNYQEWILGNSPVTIEDSFTHLGLRWNSDKRTPDVTVHVQNARRMAYSLMRIGLHGVEGLGPLASFKIINTYITPRLLHGLEATILTTSDIALLDKFHRKLLRQIQGLPESTATEAVYLLLGALPIEALWHMRILTLFGSICRLPQNHQLYRLSMRQLAVRHNNRYSWFTQLSRIADKYDINVYKQILFPWPKQAWKTYIKGVITDYTIETLINNSKEKSSLKWLILKEQKKPQAHSVWHYNISSNIDLQGANLRARMVTGRYKNQTLIHKFNQDTSPQCTLCKVENEDTEHMISKCCKTTHIRTDAISQLNELYSTEGLQNPETSEEICMAILNGGTYWHNKRTLIELSTGYSQANRISNRFCLKLDRFRNSFHIN